MEGQVGQELRGHRLRWAARRDMLLDKVLCSAHTTPIRDPRLRKMSKTSH
jgi:hypothetical protein